MIKEASYPPLKPPTGVQGEGVAEAAGATTREISPSSIFL
jgi:hypothetical protein